MLDPRVGVVNIFLDELVGVRPFNIYSFWGIIWVHIASSSLYYPVILLLPFFRRMATSLEEAARMSGASQFTATWRIVFPLLIPGIISVMFLGFMRGLEVFEVELLLGLPARIYIYSTLIYDFSREEPPLYSQAAALGLVFLLAMAVFAIFYHKFIRSRQFTTVTSQGLIPTPIRLGRWRYLAATACFSFVTIALIVPGILLVVGSFQRRFGFFQQGSTFTLDHWYGVLGDPVFMSSVKNSLIIASVTALVTIFIYSLVAYGIVRIRSRITSLTDILVWLPWAVPGVLLSLAVFWMIMATPLRTILYGSLIGMILAFVIQRCPLSTQMLKAALLQVSQEMEESAQISGASWFTMYRRILIPIIAPTALTVGLINFISSMREVGTPALLYSFRTRPISILMLEYGIDGQFERAAVIGVLITFFILLIALVARRLGTAIDRRHAA